MACRIRIDPLHTEEAHRRVRSPRERLRHDYKLYERFSRRFDAAVNASGVPRRIAALRDTCGRVQQQQFKVKGGPVINTRPAKMFGGGAAGGGGFGPPPRPPQPPLVAAALPP